MKPRYSTEFSLYPYKKVAAENGPAQRHPVVIVGGGPVGLGLALDLGKKGTPVLVLDDHDGPGQGSKAICFAKRTLDIAHRLGAGQKMVDKGVVWNVGRVFYGDGQLFEFNLLPEDGHRNPAFINLQQPYFEKFIYEEIEAEIKRGAPIEVRGQNAVTSVEPTKKDVLVSVTTPEGEYQLRTDWLIACDGARSPIRTMMGLDFEGRVFEDNFLIADVRMKADFPTERWFWFEPPFEGAGQSALLHKQPDDIWRIDFQLGWDIDREKELNPVNIKKRVDAMLSSQNSEIPEYDLHWTSIYTFQCRRMKNFRHGRIFFAGDSAHQVSPFGARGANSGMQDAENLAWKLHAVLDGKAPERLLDTYGAEREFAADENILNSSRATDFMTPKSEVSKMFSDAVLALARENSFARPLVNSGRLSVPCIYDGFASFGLDELQVPLSNRPGSACSDTAIDNSFFLDGIQGDFQVIAFGCVAPQTIDVDGLNIKCLSFQDYSHQLKERYLGSREKAVYLIRPDQHVVARWLDFDIEKITAGVRIALAKEV